MTESALPEGWRWLPLGDIATTRLGGNYRNGQLPTSRPLIKMGNIARVSIDLSQLEYVPESEDVSASHRLRYGDVLLNTRNTLDLVGKVSIWRGELPVAYYNSNILRLEFKPEYCGSSIYFGYALNSRASIRAIRALATGTTSVAAIYTRDLLKLRIAVPPKAEQEGIAAVLEDTDSLIVSLERLIKKKRWLKIGMLHHLLTRHTRLAGFKRRWVDTSAGAVGTFQGGSGFPIVFQGAASGTYPFFKVSDMNSSGNGVLMTQARHYITEEQRKKIGAVAFPKHAIVFAKVGAAIFLERKRILAQPSCIDNNMAAMIVDRSKADVRFVHYALTRFRFSSLVATGALPSLNSRQLRSIPLSLPTDLAEQRAIARALSDVDGEIAVLSTQLEKAEAIKHGMMQRLLTGQRRLTEEEVVAA